MVHDDRLQTCPGCSTLLSGGEHLVQCWVAFETRLVREYPGIPGIQSLPEDEYGIIKRTFDAHTAKIRNNRDLACEAALTTRRDELVFLVARELVEQMAERTEREATTAQRRHPLVEVEAAS